MKCKNVQFLLTSADANAKDTVRTHVERCPKCQAYAEYLHRLKCITAGLEHPKPSGSLIANTYTLIRAREAGYKQSLTNLSAIPGFVRTLVILFLMLMICWFVGITVVNTSYSQIGLVKGFLSLIIIVQNLVMLICSPLLLGAGINLRQKFDLIP